jgi:hypothetical protein
MNSDEHPSRVRRGVAGIVRGMATSRRTFLQTVAVQSTLLPVASTLLGHDAHAATPGPVPIWWRSDDVGVDKPQFARLLDIARRRQAPGALAMVPNILKANCTARILNCPQATVVQHGIAHANNAAAGKPIELGGNADRALLAQRLQRGRERLAGAFGGRFLPMQVPPWGRIDPDVTARLPALGFQSLSTYGRRRAMEAAPGLPQVNIHLDLYRWAAPRGALTYEEALSRLTALVRASKGEPIGIVTHHSVMNEQAFVILERILTFVQQQKNMKLSSIGELLGQAR